MRHKHYPSICSGPIMLFMEKPDDQGGGSPAAEPDAFRLENADAGTEPPNFDAFFDADGQKKAEGEPEIEEEVKEIVEEVKKADEPKKEEPKKDEPKKEEAVKEQTDDKATKEAIEADKKAKEKQEREEKAAKATEEEIGAMELKQSVSENTRTQFNELRSIAKVKTKLANELQLKVKELEEKTKNTLDDKTKAEIEELRKYRQTHELGNDPEIAAEFKAKLDDADTALFDILCSDRLKLPRKTPADDPDALSEESIRAMGTDTPEGREAISAILQHMEKAISDPLLKRKVYAAIDRRESVAEEREKKIELLRKDAGSYAKQREEQEQAKTQKWSKELDQHAMNILEDPEMEWACRLEAKEGASEEDKKRIAEHNKLIDEEYLPKVQDTLRNLFVKDPATVANVALRSLECERAKKQAKEAIAELEKVKGRLAAAERLAKGVRRVSSVESENTPTNDKNKPEASVTQSAGDAMDEFFGAKGKTK